MNEFDIITGLVLAGVHLMFFALIAFIGWAMFKLMMLYGEKKAFIIFVVVYIVVLFFIGGFGLTEPVTVTIEY